MALHHRILIQLLDSWTTVTVLRGGGSVRPSHISVSCSHFNFAHFYKPQRDVLPDMGQLQLENGGYYIYIFSPMARQPLGGLGCLILRRFTITHFLDTLHSVGLLWTSDQPVAETFT